MCLIRKDRLFYTWATPLFSLARRKNKVGEELEQEDLYDLPVVDETDYLVGKFNAKWDSYVVSGKSCKFLAYYCMVC